ncbi:hypothetical protein [Flavobacterium sp. N502540]|uniref:hypothetical protein n=1 Tax=Flavobacterium sp. N502540 TaxID=2986838 RepID=UPI0022251715|nr:hypothetical protein [Flavobacterium sp. N502540]
MDQLNPLTQFFKAIEKDRRISITHIGIFAALLQFRTTASYINPIKAYRHEIMKIAKISGPVTYHRCIRDLNDYGYINYLPKRNKNQKSIIYFTV